MILIHHYNSRYFEGLLLSGIMKEGDGLKINKNWGTPDEYCFNRIAVKDGALYRTVRDLASCFYIDRLQGGTFYSYYPYNMELAAEYDRITDGNFLGWQLHESGHTRALDWKRIQAQLNVHGLDWTLENIIWAVRLVSHNKTYPHFSNGAPHEYAALTPPETMSEYTADLLGMWKNRQERYGGRIINCDAGRMPIRLEAEADVNLSFIEIGAQTPNARIMYALRRGISRARGKKWGVYYEPWTSEGTAYCFMRDKSNEWFIDIDRHLCKASPEGGSSMSLARRVMAYSLFAGADYFSEEWGMANTFYEWDTFELTPYGKIKQDFQNFSRNFAHVKPTVPAAMVLPREFAMVCVHGELHYPDDMTAPEHRDAIARIQAYFDNGVRMGNEDKVFTAGANASLFDIIFDDSYAEPSKEYKLLIDFSGRLHGENVVNGYDREAADAAISRMMDGLPFTLEDGGAGLDFQLFSANGKSYVAVYNHRGVSKTIADGETQNPDAAVRFTMRMKDGSLPEVIDYCGIGWEAAEHTVCVTLGGGEFILCAI